MNADEKSEACDVNHVTKCNEPDPDELKDAEAETIYLDNNATTPLEDEVLETILQSLKNDWANPSSSYSAGKKAKQVINEARKQVAGMLGGHSSDIIFTSGGTECNSMVLNTALHYFNDEMKADLQELLGENVLPHIITSNIEHDAINLVLEAFQHDKRAEVTYLPVSKLTGAVIVQDVISCIRRNTCLITLMLANNETGAIQPVGEVFSRVQNLRRGRHRILTHSDAAQAIGKVTVDVHRLHVDYLTLVGHKFYGPRVGALYVRGPGERSPLHPLFLGGGQERGFRSGTENTPLIAGLGKACELVQRNLTVYIQHMKEMVEVLEKSLLENFGAENLRFNSKFCNGGACLPNTCNVSILKHGVQSGRTLLSLCKHVQASVGAACHSSTNSSSVLVNSGVEPSVAEKAIRLSIGRYTKEEDCIKAVADLVQASSMKLTS